VPTTILYGIPYVRIIQYSAQLYPSTRYCTVPGVLSTQVTGPRGPFPYRKKTWTQLDTAVAWYPYSMQYYLQYGAQKQTKNFGRDPGTILGHFSEKISGAKAGSGLVVDPFQTTSKLPNADSTCPSLSTGTVRVLYISQLTLTGPLR
jgi:hypothetical protein